MRYLLVVSLLIVVAGCAQRSDSADRPIQMNSDLPVAETVNGVAVPQALLDAFARGHGVDLSKPEQREQVLRVFADYVLLAQQARRDNMFVKPAFAAQVEIARLSALAKATMTELQQQTPLTDAALKAEYDAQVAHASKFEYDFTQLLFDNESDALEASGDILAGKPFAQVYEAWKGKAKQAKAFTRVRPEQLPAALSSVIATLKNGETTRTPVRTEFGWHVLRLDIANPFVPPPFDQVKENIRRTLALKVGEERLDQLKKQAKIEYPPGSAPLPEPAANPAPPASALPARR
ncbi:MAG: peptidylprolyl isomerase [Rudaea sp.]